jgi:hypothetical protein
MKKAGSRVELFRKSAPDDRVGDFVDHCHHARKQDKREENKQLLVFMRFHAFWLLGAALAAPLSS